jgi:hypothetical protein
LYVDEDQPVVLFEFVWGNGFDVDAECFDKSLVFRTFYFAKRDKGGCGLLPAEDHP